MGAGRTHLAVHQILTQYLEVHDQVFAFSLRKIIPIPGLFQPINYARATKQLNELSILLKELAGECESESPKVTLALYIERLNMAVSALSEICAALAKKTIGKPYPVARYQQD